MLNIIEFASDSVIWLDKNGKIEREYYCGQWLALLSIEEADTMMKQYLYFEQMGKTFAWYLDG